MNLLEIGWGILRRLPPLVAWRILHSMPEWLLDWVAAESGRPPPPQGLETSLLGKRLEHPVGIAAGLDKDGRLLRVAWAMGAGFHVVGSVLPRPNPGVKPMVLVRLPDGGTINRLGLPSPGPGPVVERLRARRPPGMPVAVSIAAFTPEGYGEVYRAVSGVADWVEINISCPNVESHRSFEEPEIALEICGHLKPRGIPALLKIPPTQNEERLEAYLDVARECDLQGIVAGNTMRIEYRGVPAGLGGPRLYPTTLKMTRLLREWAPRGFVIVAVGGIDSGEKLLELLDAGADAVEVLSAVIHRGPRAPWIIAFEASRILARRVARQYPSR
jgi:dihydroorotate dehydrogenase